MLAGGFSACRRKLFTGSKMPKWLASTRAISTIKAEYVWIGGSGMDLRSKTRVFQHGERPLADGKVTSLEAENYPKWTFDGSSTNQAVGHDSEVWLRPVKIVPDPLRMPQSDDEPLNVVVLCDTLNGKSGEPLETNRRAPANEIMSASKVASEKPWFGLEQEYTMFEKDSSTPLGWPKYEYGPYGYPAEQGPYYCGNGTGKVFGRDLVEAHLDACLYAGLGVQGINAEVMPGSWEFSTFPLTGIDAGDQVWLMRYFLERMSEDYDIVVSYAPKPVKEGDWNGAGSHCNFSTESMRNKGGMAHITAAMDKLAERHDEHIAVYGSGNEERLSGKHETAHISEFSWGIADRGRSVRVGRPTAEADAGFFEDRRPAANCDPYDVIAALAYTCVLHESA